MSDEVAPFDEAARARRLRRLAKDKGLLLLSPKGLGPGVREFAPGTWGIRDPETADWVTWEDDLPAIGLDLDQVEERLNQAPSRPSRP